MIREVITIRFSNMDDEPSDHTYDLEETGSSTSSISR